MNLAPLAVQQFFDNNGRPLVGGLLFTYEAGTSTKAETYLDEAGTPNTNPIELDFRGECRLWLDPEKAYKFVLSPRGDTDPPTRPIWTADNVTAGATLADITQQFIGERLWPRTAAEIAAGVTPTNYAYPELNVRRYGATGDGAADDTVAVHAAFAVAVQLVVGSVYFPHGQYRVTSGYTISGESVAIRLYSDSSPRQDSASSARIILDSASSTSFFLAFTGTSRQHHLQVENIGFACAQFVDNRDFFRFSSTPYFFTFDNVYFQNVERPLVCKAGSYFQCGNLTNVFFRDSCSIHSESASLVGTLLVLDNVCIEGGTAPDNTEKVLMNLQGIRVIVGTNLLIEPAIPSSGWTGLLLNNADPDNWTRTWTAIINGLWLETTGATMAYAIDQAGGRSEFSFLTMNTLVSAPIRLRDSAAIEIKSSSFSGSVAPVTDYFSLEDYTCQVKLTNCNARDFGDAILSPQYTLDNCSLSPSGANDALTATSFDNTSPVLLGRFDGGYLDAGYFSTQLFSGTTYTPTTHATYGRALTVIPSSNTINMLVEGRTRGDFPQGGQFFIVMKGVAPTLSSGALTVNLVADGSVVYEIALLASGEEFSLVIPATASTADPTTVGVGFNTTTATGNMTIYQLEVWVGKSLPNIALASYPNNVITFNSAAPTAGSWARGDVVWNTAPSSGATPGWVCTAAGTPGTWTAMANLA